METLELCRLCALEKDNLLGIYDSEGLTLTLDAKIKKCLNIQVSEKENFPKSICMDCYSKLDAFDEFLDSSLNAQATLSILYSGKAERLSVLNLSDEEAKSEGEYEDHDESFMLNNVPTAEELDIGKPEFMDNKAYTDHTSGNLDHCNGVSDEKNMLSSVDNEFANSKTVSDEIIEEESDVDSDTRTKDWELPTTWLCSDCSEQFSDVLALRQHHRTDHKQDARYMCDYCSKLFIEFQSFLSHVRRHKNSLKYSCEVCGKAFSNKKFIQSHQLVHTELKPHSCGECGKSFRQQSSLFIHARCHLPDNIKNKYPCELCNKRFSTKPNLVTHMRIHAGVRNFTCDQCGKSFIQKGNLDAHLLTHSHDKPFECELCSKRFKTAMQLRKHHSVHTGAKPHQCDVCGRTFREKGTLREHHRIHTGAMPFTCEYCGKAFRFKGILTTHRRQHTGERPYSCLECQHHFTNWPNYNKHMKRRHGINTSRSTRSDKMQPSIGQMQPSTLSISQPVPPPPPPPRPAIQSQHTSHEAQPSPASIYQEIQQTDLYANLQSQSMSPGLPTYMAYNVYSLSQVTPMDGSTIEIMPRHSISIKDDQNGGAVNFQT